MTAGMRTMSELQETGAPGLMMVTVVFVYLGEAVGLAVRQVAPGLGRSHVRTRAQSRAGIECLARARSSTARRELPPTTALRAGAHA